MNTQDHYQATLATSATTTTTAPAAPVAATTTASAEDGTAGGVGGGGGVPLSTSDLRPQVGDRVIVDDDNERFCSAAGIEYFKCELEERGVDGTLRWCTAPVSRGEKGNITCVFQHRKRSDEPLVFIVNVDGRGLIATTRKGIVVRLCVGMQVLLVPRLSVDMSVWRVAARIAFPKTILTVPIEDVTRCTGCVEATAPHPRKPGQFSWLVRLDDTMDEVYVVAHPLDLVKARPEQLQAIKSRKRRREEQGLPYVLVRSTRDGEDVHHDAELFSFKGCEASVMQLAVRQDPGFLICAVRDPVNLEGYLYGFYAAPSDEGLAYW